MPSANWIILLHFAAIWMSVAIGLMAGWTLPLRLPLSIPLGLLLWCLGFLLNLRVIRSFSASSYHISAPAQRSSRRIFARTVMNLGIAVASRSWFTIILSALLIPFYVSAARRRRMYLDYLRTGMLSDALPHRVIRK